MKLILVVLFSTCLISAQGFMFKADSNWDPELKYEWPIFVHEPKPVNNIEYLGKSYNIFFANPHSTSGLDPGFNNNNVIELVYDGNFYNNLEFDFKKYIPRGVRCNVLQSCQSSYSSKQVESMSKYVENLSASVSVEGTFPAASFSASFDFKSMNEQISKQETLFVESQASCAVYDLAFITTPSFQPKIKPEFAQILSALEGKGDDSVAYYDFFDSFGTHVVDKVQLGSRFGYRFELKVSETSSMQQKGFNVEAAASAFGFSGNFGIQNDSSRLDQFKSALKSWKQFSVGALPDPDNDVGKWATQSVTNPMPIKSRIIPYEKVLDTFTKRDASGLTAQQINNLKTRFATHLATYCQNRLLVNGKIASCQASKAVLNLATTAEVFLTDFDRLIKNGKLPVIIQNAKSSLFLKTNLINQITYVTQNYYPGTDEFQYYFKRVSQTKNLYQIKNKKQDSAGKDLCLALNNKCGNWNQNEIIAEPCSDGVECQKWELILFDAKIKAFKMRNPVTQKMMCTNGRLEGQDNVQIQYQDESCENCNLYFFYLPPA